MSLSKKKIAAVVVVIFLLGLSFAPMLPDPNGTTEQVNLWQFLYRYIKLEMTVSKVVTA